MLLSDGGLIGVPEDADQLDPEVLQTRAIFDAARAGLLASVSGSRVVINLAEAQRLLDALSVARMLAGDAEDRVLTQRSVLTSAEAERRAIARRVNARPTAARYPAVGHPAARRPAHPARATGDERKGLAGLDASVLPVRSGRTGAHPAASRGAASVLVRAVLPAAAALAGAAIARRARQR